MRITEKGQVTIPLSVRESLGMRPFSEVEIEVEGDHAVIRRKANADAVAERIGRYRGAANVGLTTEQILELTRS
jgi:AbrB family looped-hinge helix DNA binding protein